MKQKQKEKRPEDEIKPMELWKNRILTGLTPDALHSAAEFLNQFGAKDWCHIFLTTELVLSSLRGKKILELGYGGPVLREPFESKGATWIGMDTKDPSEFQDKRGLLQGDLMVDLGSNRVFREGEVFDAIIARQVFETDQIVRTNIPLFVRREALREGFQLEQSVSPETRQLELMLLEELRAKQPQVAEFLLKQLSPEMDERRRRLMESYSREVHDMLSSFRTRLVPSGFFIAQFHDIPGLWQEDFERARFDTQWLTVPAVKNIPLPFSRGLQEESTSILVVARKID